MPGVNAPQPPKKTHRALWLTAAAVLAVGALVGGFFAGKAFEAPTPDAQKLPTMTFGLNGQMRVDASSSYLCYNAPVQDGGVISDENDGDCKESHTVEIYDSGDAIGTTNWSDSDAGIAAYPGLTAVTAVAEARCAASFHSLIVPEATRDGLKYRALVPTQGQWQSVPEKPGQEPTREFYCVLARADGGPISAPIVTKVK
jgi:hypothetical protein